MKAFRLPKTNLKLIKNQILVLEDLVEGAGFKCYLNQDI